MKAKGKTLIHKIPIVRHAAARPRLTFGAVLGLICGFFLPPEWDLSTRLLISLDAGLALFLILAGELMLHAKIKDIRETAAAQNDGRIAVLLLAVFMAVASLIGTVMELSIASELVGRQQGWHVALAVVTVMLSWLFVHTMFGMHYANEYYSSGRDDKEGGLEFPSNDRHRPDYWDFIHFSYIIGVAHQTADIDISSYILRRIVTFHCVVAFFFNTTVLALTVNIGASLIS